MLTLRPRAFLISAASKKDLVAPITHLNTKVPFGASFRLDYVTVWWPQVTAAAGAQTTSPDLKFVLLSTRGVSYMNPELPVVNFTTPAWGQKVRRPQPLRIEYPPGGFISLDIHNISAGPVPAMVSVTYIGMMGWGRR